MLLTVKETLGAKTLSITTSSIGTLGLIGLITTLIIKDTNKNVVPSLTFKLC
jgi:hypothetical protein